MFSLTALLLKGGGLQNLPRTLRQRRNTVSGLTSKWLVITTDGGQRILHERTTHIDRMRDEQLSEALFGKKSRLFVDSGLASLGRRYFLPVGYPASVTSKYTPFLRYNILQVGCISLSKVLSTQAMLIAVGMGQGGALPMAAVITWLLKDGLGHLGSILVGTRINTKFDSDPKRYKFLSVFLGQAANLLGILSLAKPGLFLLLTSVSSAFSRVGTLAFTSSRARIYGNFAAAGNLGDLIRCSQAQSTLATLAGTAVGVGLAPLVGADVSNILYVFFPLSAATHLLAYKAVGVIELSTLNVHRFELVLRKWFEVGQVPTVEQVASEEKFILRQSLFRVEINPPIDEAIGDEHVIYQLEKQGYTVIYGTNSQIKLYTNHSAKTDQVIQGMFSACHLRQFGKLPDAVGWDNLKKALESQKWDLSMAFIDNIDLRVCLDYYELLSCNSSSFSR